MFGKMAQIFDFFLIAKDIPDSSDETFRCHHMAIHSAAVRKALQMFFHFWRLRTGVGGGNK